MDSFALLRAMASDERARDACDPAIRKEWEALAIEWHQLATAITKAPKRDFAIHFQPIGSNNA